MLKRTQMNPIIFGQTIGIDHFSNMILFGVSVDHTDLALT